MMMDSVQYGHHGHLHGGHQQASSQPQQAQQLHPAAFHSWHGLGDSPQSSLGSNFRRNASSRGSMRKLLPQVPDMETQMSLSAKMIDRRTSTPKGSHSYGPFFLEYSLLAEYNLLQKQKMPGVYTIPSSLRPLCWFGVIFVRQGIYQEGVFRFKLLIPENYPDGDCPRVIFDHFVYHPLVEPNSFELNLNGAFPKWKRNVNHIWQVLLYLRKIFYKMEKTTEHYVNREAAELLQSDPEAYQREVTACVSEWSSRIYEESPSDDPHYITFSPYDSERHESIRRAITSRRPGNDENPNSLSPSGSGSSRSSSGRSSGLSFIEPGTYQIFSKKSSS